MDGIDLQLQHLRCEVAADNREHDGWLTLCAGLLRRRLTGVLQLVLHVVAFLIIIFILAFLPKHIPAERVFTEFYDGGGWGGIGLSTLVGIVTPLWCFVGPDGQCLVSHFFTQPKILSGRIS